MKRIISSIFMLSLLMVFSINNLQAATVDETLSNISVDEKQDGDFDKNIGNTQETLAMVQSANSKKENPLKDKNLKANGNFKIYSTVFNTESDDLAKYMVDVYEQNGSIKSIIGEDYAILKPYVNEDGATVDSLLYAKVPENDPNGKNGWSFVCSGGMFIQNSFFDTVKDSNNLKKMIKSLGVKSPKQIKIIDYLAYFPPSVYFEDNKGVEYLIPLVDINNRDGSLAVAGMKIYAVKSLMDTYFKPYALAEAEMTKKHANDTEITYGDRVNVHINTLKSVNYKEIASKKSNVKVSKVN